MEKSRTRTPSQPEWMAPEGRSSDKVPWTALLRRALAAGLYQSLSSVRRFLVTKQPAGSSLHLSMSASNIFLSVHVL